MSGNWSNTLKFSWLRLAALSLSASAALGLTLIQRSDAQTAQPRIAFAGWTLVAESCTMPDGLVEPGETVTLSIALQNIGTANTSQQLIVTLSESGGVLSPSGAQDFGRLSANGPPVARNFSFTAADQQLGTNITLTFRLSDNGVNRGMVSTTIALGLMMREADPGLCTTGFTASSPSPCRLTHCVSTRRPPFPVGNYTVICDTDAPSRFTLLLTVKDVEPPRITCPAGVTVNAASGGLTAVTYPPVTATDNCQATVSCTPASGATFPLGVTKVTCTATDTSGNTDVCAFNVTVTQEFGRPLPPSAAGSDQKPGSVLAFPVYTSGATSPQAQNTRIALTNTEASRQAFVHLFFISDNCSVSDSFICLTPQQTMTFLASDFDPGTTGYLLAVATDGAGCPANFNFLIGDEYVKFQSGHAANLGAEAFAALPGFQACAGGATSATINFDGVRYSLAPRVIAADNFAGRVDGNNHLFFINRLGGDLRVGASTLGTLLGTVYDDAENAVSLTLSAGCQFGGYPFNTWPRLGLRFETFIPAGRSGWMKFAGQSDIALFGVMLNFNPNFKEQATAYTQGHRFHHLTLTNAASLTIPVISPNC
ncbi:MAG TPA: HYR domain-containing protein [Blastocatellia bacterium]|nr:HYR domain-containing protein [Blastocatellia bacterium]HMV83168.1 HYR domain-containing protein [Blastocatellia bacterium]HMX26889.1 HYR domain-containing protein [Blastocatellia bacterium]HMY73446.1 HYR domain-containing protein [Blastocatellia bacterium]HNG31172.1 HYR domain-containing protein [Blastocatellia bacterium]